MAESVRITDDEAAILRAWLGGARPNDIAKARRVPVDDVTRALVDLCDLNRDIARRILNEDGHRLRQDGAANVAKSLAGLANPAPAPALPTFDVLERHASTRCPACRYVGPAGEHPHTCPGPPVPVEILIVGVA